MGLRHLCFAASASDRQRKFTMCSAYLRTKFEDSHIAADLPAMFNIVYEKLAASFAPGGAEKLHEVFPPSISRREALRCALCGASK